MKKLISLLLALCLTLSVLPSASAASSPVSGACGPNASYTLSGGVLTISGSGPVDSAPWYDRAPGLDLSHTITRLEIGRAHV